MTRLFRHALFALAFGLPLMAASPSGQAASPAGHQEVAQAQDPTSAQPRQRQQRPRAQRPRTNRQEAQRPRGSRQQAQRPRRARGSQG